MAVSVGQSFAQLSDDFLDNGKRNGWSSSGGRDIFSSHMWDIFVKILDKLFEIDSTVLKVDLNNVISDLNSHHAHYIFLVQIRQVSDFSE